MTRLHSTTATKRETRRARFGSASKASIFSKTGDQIAASPGARANRDAVARDHGFPHVEGNLHVPEELRQRGQPVIRVEPRAESHAGAELELRQPVTVARPAISIIKASLVRSKARLVGKRSGEQLSYPSLGGNTNHASIQHIKTKSPFCANGDAQKLTLPELAERLRIASQRFGTFLSPPSRGLPAQEMGCAHEAQAVGVLDVALPLRVGRGCEDGPAGEDYE